MAAMASMSKDKETDGVGLHPETIVTYSANIDGIREIEYPMLQGNWQVLTFVTSK